VKVIGTGSPTATDHHDNRQAVGLFRADKIERQVMAVALGVDDAVEALEFGVEVPPEASCRVPLVAAARDSRRMASARLRRRGPGLL
jgi:hypothetical protein